MIPGLSVEEERFAHAYYAYILRYAPDVEPTAKQFGITEERSEAIARFIHREIESERIKQARAFKPK